LPLPRSEACCFARSERGVAIRARRRGAVAGAGAGSCPAFTGSAAPGAMGAASFACRFSASTPPPRNLMSLCGGVPCGSASRLKGAGFVGGGGEGTSLELKGAVGGEGSALLRKAPVPAGSFGRSEWTTLRVRMKGKATRAFRHDGGGGTALPGTVTGAGACGSTGKP
jgi:hypothetical protein